MDQDSPPREPGPAEPQPDQHGSEQPRSGQPSTDLDAIAAELADVEIALARLEAGTYFTDEATGEPLPAALLIEHPTARSVPAL